MAEVREEGELGASVDDVWKVVGDFGGLLESMGLPVDVSGDGIGQTRTIALGGGAPTVERLEARDETAKSLSYSIVTAPMPLAEYLSTMQLAEAGAGRTKLVWSGTFEPAEGTAEDDAVNLVRSIYRGGIQALQARFGA